MERSLPERAPIIAAWVTIGALAFTWLVWAFFAALFSLLLFYGFDGPSTTGEKAAGLALAAATGLLAVVIVASAGALVVGRAARTWPAYNRWLGTTLLATIPSVLIVCYLLFIAG